MRVKHNFDLVHGTREVFRIFLDALANPGRPVRRQDDFFSAHGRWLAPALTFLDSETGFFWDGPPEVGEEIRFLSGAEPAPLQSADFVFLSPTAAAEEILPQVKSGTHQDPHDSALLLIGSDFSAGLMPVRVALQGPGVPPEGRTVELSPQELAWAQARDGMRFEYPCGVELVFLREDSLLALTRKVAVSWPM
ncbi:MAG: phosphonate C-P lyase system protein PhnH [Treponema sp.]|jgi:phosphonate C-P lyase system protein PhnH|nr:phosphonate C-P lyase system protein PhnH [Treponema sp.]